MAGMRPRDSQKNIAEGDTAFRSKPPAILRLTEKQSKRLTSDV